MMGFPKCGARRHRCRSRQWLPGVCSPAEIQLSQHHTVQGAALGGEGLRGVEWVVWLEPAYVSHSFSANQFCKTHLSHTATREGSYLFG